MSCAEADLTEDSYELSFSCEKYEMVFEKS